MSVSRPDRANFKSDAEFAAANKAFDAAYAKQQAEHDKAMEAYNAAEREYEAAQAKAPRVALWVMAGLYPLVFPLWAVCGLMLGVRLRGEAAREG